MGEYDVAIENGTYFVRFETPMGGGVGAFTLQGGKLRGGDGSMIYVGSYNEPSLDVIDADVTFRRIQVGRGRCQCSDRRRSTSSFTARSPEAVER
jgi:hypothetical protein